MNKKFILLTFGILLIGLVSATHIEQGATYFDDGYVINTIIPDDLFTGINNSIYFSVYDINGKTLEYLELECRFGLISPDGNRLFLLNNSDFIGNDDIWVGVIDSNFLIEEGEYSYNLDCNNGLRGGYFHGGVNVIDGGDKQFKLNLNDSVDMMILIIVLVISTVLLVFNSTRFFGGIGYAIAGLMLMFSGVNFIVSTLLLVLGLFMSALNNQ